LSGASHWTFLTNHAHVLLLLAREPDLRLRDVAEQVGITERAVARIVSELSESGYLCITKEGRRNHYEVHGHLHMRHPLEEHVTLQQIIELVTPKGAS